MEIDPKTARYGCFAVVALPVVILVPIVIIGLIWGTTGSDKVSDERKVKAEFQQILAAIERLGQWSPKRPKTGAQLARELVERQGAFLANLYRPRAGQTGDRYATDRRRLAKLLDPWDKPYSIVVDLEFGRLRNDGVRQGRIYVHSTGGPKKMTVRDTIPWTDEPPKTPTADKYLSGRLVITPPDWPEEEEEEEEEESPESSPEPSLPAGGGREF